jgi:hypothetical protein
VVAPPAQYAAFYGQSFSSTDGWVVTGSTATSYFTSCAGTRMFGGYGVLGSGASISKIISLPPHYQVDVSFTFFKIDSWDAESLLVYIDGEQSYR